MKFQRCENCMHTQINLAKQLKSATTFDNNRGTYDQKYDTIEIQKRQLDIEM